MLYPGLPLAEMGEGFGKAGALHDLQKQVRHAGLRHSPLNGWPQGVQAFRILQPVERCDHNAGFAVHGLEAQIGVARRPIGDGAVGTIEQLRQACDLCLGIQRAVERPANHQLGRLPCRAVQHSASGIAVPGARTGENIAALHGGSPCVDDGEHIGPGIGHATRICRLVANRMDHGKIIRCCDYRTQTLGLFGDDPRMLETGATYLRLVGPTYGFFGLGLSLYFASQDAGRLLWPLLAGGLHLVVTIGGGWLALRVSGTLAWVFAALALALVLYAIMLVTAIWSGVWFCNVAAPAVARTRR